LKAITSATSEGLEAALKVALRTLPPSPRTNSQFLHRAMQRRRALQEERSGWRRFRSNCPVDRDHAAVDR
jgi:hypothetical protein